MWAKEEYDNIFYQCECCLNKGVNRNGRTHCSYCGAPIDFEKARKLTYKLEQRVHYYR